MIFKLILIIVIYVSSLKIVSPIIDHEFGELDESKNNLQILFDVMMQIIVLSISWFYFHKFVKFILEKYLNLKMKEKSENLVDFISAIVLIGLQVNLFDKLEYITYNHPYRKFF